MTFYHMILADYLKLNDNDNNNNNNGWWGGETKMGFGG